MEKWRSKGKSTTEVESVLPPTRRSAGSNRPSTAVADKKNRKWSLGGFFKRISSGQRNDASSNDEEITYIPGHMLAGKRTKKVSGMRSKLAKVPYDTSRSHNRATRREEDYFREIGNKESSESVASRSASLNGDCADFMRAIRNELTNSQNSDGSPEDAAQGRSSGGGRISGVKARAEAKRHRLRRDSSSEDDSNKSSQSPMRIRSEDNLHGVQRTDSYSRKSRGARTERYIKRLSRDDCNSGSDTKLQISSNLTSDEISFVDRSIRSIERTSERSRISSPLGSTHFPGVSRDAEASPERSSVDNDRYDSRLSKRSTYDFHEARTAAAAAARESETCARSNFQTPNSGIFGATVKSRQFGNESDDAEEEKLLPPEPPPRSSKSRIFSSIRNGQFPSTNERSSVARSRSSRLRYYPSDEYATYRNYNSDNEMFNSGINGSRFKESSPGRCDHENFNCQECAYSEKIISTANPSIRERNDRRKDFENVIADRSRDRARATCSLPKGVQLFSRRKLANRNENASTLLDDDDTKRDRLAPCSKIRRSPDRVANNRRGIDEASDNETARKRSSKNLQEALFELEAIYNSLRLSDPDLLERAERRTMDEYRDNAAKSHAEYEKFGDEPSNDPTIRDDMAYRRMNPNERPPSVNGQSSLSRISYLATSPNLSIRDDASPLRTRRSRRRSSPDLTRDDLSFRNMSHAINTLRVVEPQPPFGIPLGPVTGSYESDYLHVKPTTRHEHARSLYIPKSEPDVVGDDLAFRNLRKDRDSWTVSDRDNDAHSLLDSFIDPRFATADKVAGKFNVGASCTNARGKLVGRSNSIDFNGRDSEWSDIGNDRRKWLLENAETRENRSVVPNELDINGNREKREKMSRPDDILNLTNNQDRWKNLRSENVGESANAIEQFTEREISEYREMCDDLEKLLRTASEKSASAAGIEEARDAERKRTDEDGKEPNDWDELFNDDYKIPECLLNFEKNERIRSDEARRRKREIRSSDESSRLASPRNETNGSVSADRSSNEKKRKSYEEKDDSSLFSSSSSSSSSSTARRSREATPDSVYEKFDRLLREVNDAPRIERAIGIPKYPTEELDSVAKDLTRGSAFVRDAETEPRASGAARDDPPISGSSTINEREQRALDRRSTTRRERTERGTRDVGNVEGKEKENGEEDRGKIGKIARGERDEGRNENVKSSNGTRKIQNNENSGRGIFEKMDAHRDSPIAVGRHEFVGKNVRSGKGPIDEFVGIEKYLGKYEDPEADPEAAGREDPTRRRSGIDEYKMSIENGIERLRVATIGREGGSGEKTRPKVVAIENDPRNGDESIVGLEAPRDRREGENNLMDEIMPRDNDDTYASCNEISAHEFRELGRPTNGVTVRDALTCSFFLTLLITIILAQ